jgi:hypothetical protein
VVDVVAKGLLLETQSGVTGNVVTAETIVNLPLSGRNFTSLGNLTAGVVTSATQFRASGARGMYQQVNLDGVSALNNRGNNLFIYPSADAVQEFKVQATNYSAQFLLAPAAAEAAARAESVRRGRQGTDPSRQDVLHRIHQRELPGGTALQQSQCGRSACDCLERRGAERGSLRLHARRSQSPQSAAAQRVLRGGRSRDPWHAGGRTGRPPAERTGDRVSDDHDPGFNGYGDGTGGEGIDKSQMYQFVDTLTQIRGRHALKMGADVRRLRG